MCILCAPEKVRFWADCGHRVQVSQDSIGTGLGPIGGEITWVIGRLVNASIEAGRVEYEI